MWQPQKIKMYQICNGNKSLPIKFEVFSLNSSGSEDLYGEYITTIEKLSDNSKNNNPLMFGNKNGGNLRFEQFNIIELPNFMEYLRSGWAINMSIAIDFTASNGSITDPNSLHK